MDKDKFGSKQTITFNNLVIDMSIKESIDTVVEALEDRDYNPIDQMVGYILSGDPSYITSHNNARNIIAKIDRDDLVEELLKKYLDK